MIKAGVGWQGRVQMRPLKLENNDYEGQAQEFLDRTDATCKAEFLRFGPHFNEDEDHKRDIYRVTLSRGEREYSFEFGQSTDASGYWAAYSWKTEKKLSRLNKLTPRGVEIMTHIEKENARAANATKTGGTIRSPQAVNLGFDSVGIRRNPEYAKPSPYDVLACLQKYHPGTFGDFCADFGYDTDSRRGEKTYKAVVEEVQGLERLFSDAEMELMQEIQ